MARNKVAVTILPRGDVEAAFEEWPSSWGVPDWENAAAYPDNEKTSYRQWAWEFLRRSSRYRYDWVEYELAKSKKRNVSWFHTYSLNAPTDPSRALPTPSFMASGPYVETTRRFDLGKPIRPQLRELEEELKKKRDSYVKNNIRVPISKLTRYLRVLDARDAGLSFAHLVREMAKLRAPEKDAREEKETEDTVRNWHLSAVEICLDKWWLLAARDGIPPPARPGRSLKK